MLRVAAGAGGLGGIVVRGAGVEAVERELVGEVGRRIDLGPFGRLRVVQVGVGPVADSDEARCAGAGMAEGRHLVIGRCRIGGSADSGGSFRVPGGMLGQSHPYDRRMRGDLAHLHTGRLAGIGVIREGRGDQEERSGQEGGEGHDQGSWVEERREAEGRAKNPHSSA